MAMDLFCVLFDFVVLVVSFLVCFNLTSRRQFLGCYFRKWNTNGPPLHILFLLFIILLNIQWFWSWTSWRQFLGCYFRKWNTNGPPLHILFWLFIFCQIFSDFDVKFIELSFPKPMVWSGAAWCGVLHMFPCDLCLLTNYSFLLN